MRAIEYDWILNKNEGYKFLLGLSQTQSIEVFSVNLIKNILQFLWQYYRIRIILLSFVPFCIYFTCFVVDASYFHQRKLPESDYNTQWYVSTVLMSICAVLWLYFQVLEVI